MIFGISDISRDSEFGTDLLISKKIGSNRNRFWNFKKNRNFFEEVISDSIRPFTTLVCIQKQKIQIKVTTTIN